MQITDLVERRPLLLTVQVFHKLMLVMEVVHLRQQNVYLRFVVFHVNQANEVSEPEIDRVLAETVAASNNIKHMLLKGSFNRALNG